MATQPMASPSRPSVRLTAFDEPTSTSTMKTTKGSAASGSVYQPFSSESITRSGRSFLKKGNRMSVE